jgi:hypothetical protein
VLQYDHSLNLVNVLSCNPGFRGNKIAGFQNRSKLSCIYARRDLFNLFDDICIDQVLNYQVTNSVTFSKVTLEEIDIKVLQQTESSCRPDQDGF